MDVASPIIFDITTVVAVVIVLPVGVDDDVIPVEFNSPLGQPIGMRLKLFGKVIKREAATTSSTRGRAGVAAEYVWTHAK